MKRSLIAAFALALALSATARAQGPPNPASLLTVNATVVLPTALGTFALKFDAVQEGVSWFSGQGVPAESITLTVQ